MTNPTERPERGRAAVYEAVQGSYAQFRWFWSLVPHKHYWRETTKGYRLDTHARIGGAQCFRCYRSLSSTYEESLT